MGVQPQRRRQVHRHRRTQHAVERNPLRSRESAEGEVQAAGAARTRFRVSRRPHRPALGDPHQLERKEFPRDASRRRARRRQEALARTGAGARRCVHRQHRAVQELSGHRASAAMACSASVSSRGRAARNTFVKPDETDYTATIGDNREQDTDTLRYNYTSLVTPNTVYDLDMQDRQAHAEEARSGARRLRSGQLRCRTRLGASARWREDSGVARLSQGLQEGRHRAAVSIRLRLVRRIERSALFLAALLADRPRLRLRHRARARRPGDGPRLVRERQAAEEEEHVHRFHRRDRIPGQARLRRQGQGVRRGRQRRRPADGRDREHGAAGLSRALPRTCRSSTSSRRCSTRASR